MVYTDAQKRAHIGEISELLYQIALRDGRVPAVVPSEDFTPELSLAVRAFQEAYDLPVTGEIDTATWDRITSVYHSLTDAPVPLVIFPSGDFTLREGDRGELVYFVQIMLNLLARRYENLERLTPDGEYGANTAEAVRRFQAISRLPESGVVDRTTWNHLAAFVNQLRFTI